MNLLFAAASNANAIREKLNLTATTTAPSESVSIARLTVSRASRLDWGDGSSSELPPNSTSAISHTYAVAGTYQIRLFGAESVTQIRLESAKLGGLNTSELRKSKITYFVVNLITNSIIRSSDMIGWPMTSYWHLTSMPAGTYSISSADMAAWRPYSWSLSSMPSGTYSISSADMAAWGPTNWYLYSMPTGTYTFAASCMRSWTSASVIRCDGLGLTSAAVDTILADIYAGRMGYTAAAPNLNVGGSNADPGGIYQAMVPPTTGMECAYELANDSAAQGFHLWMVTM